MKNIDPTKTCRAADVHAALRALTAPPADLSKTWLAADVHAALGAKK